MYTIGLMSGTSMDAVDAALVHLADDELKVLAYQQYSIARDIQTAVRNLGLQSTLVEITRLDHILGHLFADAVLAILTDAKLTTEEVSAIGSHGQTILHLPDDSYPRTMQIGNPNIIAARTHITTIADFRALDMAAGGQGAPLAPAFHQWYFRTAETNRVILNIGGMANITLLPAEHNMAVTGFDTGPGNALMDDWIQTNLGKDYDAGGQWASSGQVDPVLLKTLLDEPYFAETPPKSTGRDLFNLQWLQNKLASSPCNHKPEDIQSTLLALSGKSIAREIINLPLKAEEILVCGGGIHNTALMGTLKAELGEYRLHSTNIYGIDPDAVEAICFAWLARQRLQGLAGNLPSVTGAHTATPLGAIYSATTT